MEHIDTAIALFFALHAVAVIVVNVTPTPKDDKVLSRIYQGVEKAAGIITKRAKESSK